MNHQQQIHQYLAELQLYLARLAPSEAQEVVREIESHLFDVIEQQQAQGEALDIPALLAGFGSPRQLAEQYVAHITSGEPPPRGFKVIKAVTRGVSASLYYSMAVLGASWVLSLLFIAGVKLIHPELVGAWSDAGGQSINVGFVDVPPAGKTELLGYWIVPVAAGLALLGGIVTRQVLKVLKRQL